MLFGFELKNHLNRKRKNMCLLWLTFKKKIKSNQCGLGWFRFLRDLYIFVHIKLNGKRKEIKKGLSECLVGRVSV